MADLEQDSLLADLSAYLDGELGAARAAEVARLLAESPDARRMLGELREVRDRVRALPRQPAPAELGTRLSPQIQARLSGLRRTSFWSGRVLRVGVPLAAAAAAVLAIGFLLRSPARPEAQTAGPHTAQRLSRKAAGTPPLEPAAPLAAVAMEKPEAQPPEADSERLTDLGYAAEESAAAPVAAEGSVVAVVIQARDEAEYARNAALLERWSREAGPAEPVRVAALPGGKAGSEVYPAAAARAVEAGSGATPRALAYVYQLALPELDARVAHLLEVNPREQVAIQSNVAADHWMAEDQSPPPVPLQGESGGVGPARAAPPRATEHPMTEKKEAAAGKQVPRGVAAPAASGKGGAVRQPIVGDQRDEAAMRERLHAQHMAVTAEPEVILIEQAPASQPSASQPGPTTRAAGMPAREGGRGGGVGGATTQATPPRVELRVELLPAAPTTAPASRPAREVGGGARD